MTDENGQGRKDLDRKNIRVAIALGLVAAGIYLFFILRFAATR